MALVFFHTPTMVKGNPLFLNDDGTVSGRVPDALSCVAEFDEERGKIVCRYVLYGTMQQLGDEFTFPYDPGKSELVCDTDPRLTLVRGNTPKVPWVLSPRFGAVLPSDRPW